MIVKFNNDYLLKLFLGKLIKSKPKFSKQVITNFMEAIETLKSVQDVSELKKIRSLNFESLKGKLKGYYSIRIDRSYRLILSVEKDLVQIQDILVVEELTNHYQ